MCVFSEGGSLKYPPAFGLNCSTFNYVPKAAAQFLCFFVDLPVKRREIVSAKAIRELNYLIKTFSTCFSEIRVGSLDKREGKSIFVA